MEQTKMSISNIFAKFLIQTHSLDELAYECKQRNGDSLCLLELLNDDNSGAIIDRLFGWNHSRKGWNYWANISYAWKITLKCMGLYKEKPWEKDSEEFTLLPPIQDYINRLIFALYWF